jgi:hypothetical protein
MPIFDVSFSNFFHVPFPFSVLFFLLCHANMLGWDVAILLAIALARNQSHEPIICFR